MGAAAAGLAVQALLRLPHSFVQGTPSLIAAIAVVPLFGSAYRYAPGRGRRRTRRFALYGGAVGIVLLGLAVVAGFLAKSHVEDGIAQAQGGFDAVQSGDRDIAVAQLTSSASSFGDAADALGAWWAAPARVLPIVGQQMSAVKTMAEEGRTLASNAAQAAGVINYDDLRVKGGAIDISLLRSVQAPIANTAAALDVAAQQLSNISVDWLLPPIRDRFDTLNRQITRVRPAAAIASDVIAVAPEMLGADTPQHYLVLFGSPSETRELGGFVGNFAEVTADKGKLTLTRSGRALELSDAKGLRGRTLTAGDYLQPFAPYRVTQFFGNVSASPNFPDVASVAEQLYPQAGGDQLDGVFYMDPYALASLLDLTGPITLKGSSTKLTSKNAAHTLLVDQYTQIPDNGVRNDFLDEATRVTFEQLTSGNLPKPVAVANVMSPAVDQGRLFAHSTHPEVEALYQKLALDGTVAAPKESDYLSVTQSNENPSKIDAYLQRDISYDATFWPDTGQVDGTLRIRLTNSAPAALLPDDVIGNARGLPPGTNRLQLTIYSPLGAKGATINDAAVAIGSAKRFGLSAYTVAVDVPPGASVRSSSR